MSRIVVHIDKLVLNGVAETDAAQVSAGIREAIARELGARSTAAPLIADGDRTRVRTGRVAAGADFAATAQAIGTRIVTAGKP
jgi:hypothetical protein